MNEEIMNVEVNELESVDCTEDMELYEESGNSGAKFIALGIGTLLAGGAVALYHKNKEKIEEMRIKRWEKKGYVIYKPEDAVETEAVESAEENVEDSTDKKKKK